MSDQPNINMPSGFEMRKLEQRGTEWVLTYAEVGKSSTDQQRFSKSTRSFNISNGLGLRGDVTITW